MMTTLRVAAATLNQTPLDWTGNLERATRAIDAARDQGADVVCLPELCLSGYGCDDMLLSAHVMRETERQLTALCPSSRGLIVAVGVAVESPVGHLNAAALLVDGALHGITGKQFLAREGLHYEPRWFAAQPRGTAWTRTICGTTCLIGDVTYAIGPIRIGFEICEDAWSADRPAPDLARRGVNLILNPSASHFAFGKSNERRELIRQASAETNAAYVYANLVGNEAGRAVYDGSCYIASAGEIVAASPRFTFAESSVTVADVTLIEPPVECDAHTVRIEPIDAAPKPPLPAPPTDDAMTRDEEFTTAVSLGLFDYVRKSRSRGFVLSLSGGADSAATAILASLALSRADAALGREAVDERLSYWPELRTMSASERTARWLTCAYQGTANSSAETECAAAAVADGLGAAFHVLDIEDIVMAYRARVERAIDRPLTWETDDLALQNIQARVRAPSVWMLANIHNALLLATSNRSEAAVGYTTMDGDTAGGFAPVAGIDKAFLRRWLRTLECSAIGDVDEMPFLTAINALEPTAELRPPSADQRDEDDLMPYDVLDQIERLAIHERRSPQAVFDALRDQHDDGTLRSWINRFYALWSRNQWKRERFAPSIHVDDANLDPRSWCRFPILSGGFRRELAELGTDAPANQRRK